ncbi:MAG: hypothetical protein ACTSXA_00695 [Candidatus Heimdallarchaeota archaeon]
MAVAIVPAPQQIDLGIDDAVRLVVDSKFRNAEIQLAQQKLLLDKKSHDALSKWRVKDLALRAAQHDLSVNRFTQDQQEFAISTDLNERQLRIAEDQAKINKATFKNRQKAFQSFYEMKLFDANRGLKVAQSIGDSVGIAKARAEINRLKKMNPMQQRTYGQIGLELEKSGGELRELKAQIYNQQSMIDLQRMYLDRSKEAERIRTTRRAELDKSYTAPSTDDTKTQLVDLMMKNQALNISPEERAANREEIKEKYSILTKMQSDFDLSERKVKETGEIFSVVVNQLGDISTQEFHAATRVGKPVPPVKFIDPSGWNYWLKGLVSGKEYKKGFYTKTESDYLFGEGVWEDQPGEVVELQNVTSDQLPNLIESKQAEQLNQTGKSKSKKSDSYIRQRGNKSQKNYNTKETSEKTIDTTQAYQSLFKAAESISNSPDTKRTVKSKIEQRKQLKSALMMVTEGMMLDTGESVQEVIETAIEEGISIEDIITSPLMQKLLGQ